MSISDRLNQIEQRADNATEGPWEKRTVRGWEKVVSYSTDAMIQLVAELRHEEHDFADAEFIAHARTDVPDLLAAVRAVLDACDRIDASIIPSGDFEVGQKSVTQTVRMIVERKLSTAPSAAESARIIATALGEEQ